MSESASATRGLFTGVANIVRFNPGFFIVGAGVGGMGCLGLFLFADRLPSGVGLLAWITWGIGIWWVFASLLASWWIYDLSALYRWDWLAKRIGAGSRRLVVAHAGFDEVTWSLRQRFPSLEITPVDFHDAGRMTEPSILRARRLCPPLPGTLPVGLDPWRLPDVPEAIVFPLSAHEWRLPEERVRLLRCAKEALVPGGSILSPRAFARLLESACFRPRVLSFSFPRHLGTGLEGGRPRLRGAFPRRGISSEVLS
jgi:hypothetical protein